MGNIVFGKFDATSNDVPYMFPPLKGYPTLFFLSAYEKFDPIQYQGDRTYKSVKDWINRHSSIFLSEEERTGQAADDDEKLNPLLPRISRLMLQPMTNPKQKREKMNSRLVTPQTDFKKMCWYESLNAKYVCF